MISDTSRSLAEELLAAARLYLEKPSYSLFFRTMRTGMLKNSHISFCMENDIIETCDECPMAILQNGDMGYNAGTCLIYDAVLSTHNKSSYEDNEALVIIAITKLVALLEARI